MLTSQYMLAIMHLVGNISLYYALRDVRSIFLDLALQLKNQVLKCNLFNISDLDQPITTPFRFAPQLPGFGLNTPAQRMPQKRQHPDSSRFHSDSSYQSRPINNLPQP